ncbi:hypothetical protein K469DRAFT_793820 [Zopfia rhizophila CBS 207.26]|uniref:Uncharacterized protein n=1 Tax=Zopfia rhizophila CBS 207.26 TaxID=1314779 RepID=A0A6A6DSV9_9PEZI|nr:hypothetical protein K469DRAFT_793820 [Zopfia rhizophila CBS 207.26]
MLSVSQNFFLRSIQSVLHSFFFTAFLYSFKYCMISFWQGLQKSNTFLIRSQSFHP